MPQEYRLMKRMNGRLALCCAYGPLRKIGKWMHARALFSAGRRLPPTVLINFLKKKMRPPLQVISDNRCSRPWLLKFWFEGVGMGFPPHILVRIWMVSILMAMLSIEFLKIIIAGSAFTNGTENLWTSHLSVHLSIGLASYILISPRYAVFFLQYLLFKV